MISAEANELETLTSRHLKVVSTNGNVKALCLPWNQVIVVREPREWAHDPVADNSVLRQIVPHSMKVPRTLTSGDPLSLWLFSPPPTPVPHHLESYSCLDTPPPVSPSLKTTPVAQRKKLALLPRSEHPQEPPSTLQSITDESPSTRTNPFGAARPVDTDSALKKVEEKLAREKIKEHKEDSAPSKRTTSPTAPASASTGPRHEKPRSHPKQLLRRAPHNSSAAPNSTPSSTEVGDIATQKQEGQRSETASESTGGSWRKKADVEMVSSPPEEPGWETVPARGKKVNGVAVKH